MSGFGGREKKETERNRERKERKKSRGRKKFEECAVQ